MKNEPYIVTAYETNLSDITQLNFKEKYIAFGDSNGQIAIKDLKNNNSEIKLLGHKDRINSLEFNTEESLLISTSNDNTLKLWDLNSNGLFTSIKSHNSSINEARINEAANSVLSCDIEGNLYNTNLINFKSELLLNNNNTSINCLKNSKDNKISIFGDNKGVINIFDIEKQKILYKYYKDLVGSKNDSSHKCMSLNFSIDDNSFFTGFSDGSLQLVDIRIKSKIWEIFPFDNNGYINNSSCSIDGHYLLLSGVSKYAKILDLRSGNVLNNILCSDYDENYSEFSKHSNYFATGGDKGACVIWKNTYSQNNIETINITSSYNKSTNKNIEYTYNTSKSITDKMTMISNFLENLNSKINLLEKRVTNNNNQLVSIEEYFKNKFVNDF